MLSRTRSFLNYIPKKNSQKNIHTLICPKKFDSAVTKLRTFFQKKGFIETHTQNRLSILAACEDPFTISTFNYGQELWPLPQTGQMWLEYELLKNPTYQGLFCLSTSYRNEPEPIPGRHDMIFPMFEFEIHGGMEQLINLQSELLVHLGFQPNYKNSWQVKTTKDKFPRDSYRNVSEQYGVKEINHNCEKKLQEDFGNVFFLTDFPNYTSPFWNMSRHTTAGENFKTGDSKKVDVIINGAETIGSAERSCDPEYMREQFYKISKGEYAATLFNKFSKKRVEEELEFFLNSNFFSRSGGGIGMTRLIKAMEENNLL